MNARIFTLAEARSLLPVLKERISRLQQLKIDLQEEWDQLEDRLGDQTNDLALARSALKSSRVIELSNTYNSIMTQLEKLGVEVKSVEQGLVDFPYIVAGRLVYLCWQSDEPTISWWHEPEDGFAGRKLLVDVPIFSGSEEATIIH